MAIGKVKIHHAKGSGRIFDQEASGFQEETKPFPLKAVRESGAIAKQHPKITFRDEKFRYRQLVPGLKYPLRIFKCYFNTSILSPALRTINQFIYFSPSQTSTLYILSPFLKSTRFMQRMSRWWRSRWHSQV